ncbi:enoyl-CoA hydratase/isomerase family protein [Chloroflexota bacterium]
MPYTTILFDIHDDIAQITLNRPEAANSINKEISLDLMHAAINCSEDQGIRAVVITGAGTMFCAGGDLKTFAAQGKGLPAYLKEVTVYMHAAISQLSRLDAPVIAAVNGNAAGAGLSLICGCDYVIATETARFTAAYTKAGLTPDGGLTYFLPRILGTRRALELVLTNRILSAKEAFELGIVNRVVGEAEVMEQAHATAAQMANGATKALGTAKRLLYTGWMETLETQMQHESQAIAEISATADGREGIAAFLEKRPPKFTGQ